jgi:hypothetical protein
MKLRCACILAALLASLSASSAFAAATLYQYTIWNLANPYFGTPGQPALVPFKGLFAGEDLDGNGIIERPEVTEFYIGMERSTFDRLVPAVFLGQGPDCIPDNSPTQCIEPSHLDRFSYDLRTGHFEAAGEYPNWRDSLRLVTGERVFLGTCGGCTAADYLWTPSSYVTVVALPVPEPGTWMLLAAGLLALVQRLRKGSSTTDRGHASPASA